MKLDSGAATSEAFKWLIRSIEAALDKRQAVWADQ
jgi:hypothetical protein